MSDQMGVNRLGGSFRDPSGYVFKQDGVILRRIDKSYFGQFEKLHDSGLYDYLTSKRWLVRHETIDSTEDFITIRPEQLAFVSYPYEWSFSYLKQAAIVTLDIQLAAIEHGMSLKDASAYNLQHHQGKMVFIDTLSFENRTSDQPWTAYRQFCQHFLAPLILMAHISPEINKTLSVYLDGIPLDIAARMLPLKAKLSPTVYSNIVLHAKSYHANQASTDTNKVSQAKLSDTALKRIILNLKLFIQSLQLKSFGSEWENYYDFKNYNNAAFTDKEQLIKSWTEKYDFKSVWDLGGNNGHFTNLVAEHADFLICSDIDPNAIEACSINLTKKGNKNILPLVIDFTNPSPACGAMNKERDSFFERIESKKLDCIFALAVIHHLSITHHQSFQMIAMQLAALGQYLMIEFVGREDSWVRNMLASKLSAYELYDFYNQQAFEKEFSAYFDIIEISSVESSDRTLYLMKSK